MAPERPRLDKPEGDIPFELGIDDITVGAGAEATAGAKVSVHYVGVAFSTGEEFDASWNRGQPFEFKLGKAADASSYGTSFAFGALFQLCAVPFLLRSRHEGAPADRAVSLAEPTEPATAATP